MTTSYRAELNDMLSKWDGSPKTHGCSVPIDRDYLAGQLDFFIAQKVLEAVEKGNPYKKLYDYEARRRMDLEMENSVLRREVSMSTRLRYGDCRRFRCCCCRS